MSYNLRPRTIASALMHENNDCGDIVDDGSESEDHVSNESEYTNTESENDDTDANDNMQSDWENASLDQRLLESRARGRPTSYLRGSLDVKPFLERRYSNEIIRRSLRESIATILGKTRPNDAVERVELPSKKRCGLCPRSKDRKTNLQCPACEQPMCNDHRIYLCTDCGGQD